MKTLITICGRGGSKGIPNKNIRPLNGKPLIAYTIAAAQAYRSKYPDTVIGLSTDSDAILEVSRAYGVDTVYRRPDELGQDSTGKIAVLASLVEFEESSRHTTFDRIIDLDITSPLRTLADIERTAALLDRYPAALNAFSVSRPHRNPYFNMVEETAGGYVTVVKRPETPFLSRQAAPAVYDMNGSIYVYTRAFFAEGRASATTERSVAYLMEHQCFDLDHTLDLEFMDFLLSQRKLDFDFTF